MIIVGAHTQHRCAVNTGDLVISKFISWSGDAIEDTAAGYLAELEKIGEAVNVSTGLGPSPLRLVSSHRRLLGADNPQLVSVSITLYDPTLSGSEVQDATTVDAIHNSANPAVSTSYRDAYAQSWFRFAATGGWQPNFVRPRLLINGHPVLFDDFDIDSGRATPLADLSIGLDVPWCMETNIRLKRKINEVRMFCPAGQIVGEKIQRYIVSAELVWNIEE